MCVCVCVCVFVCVSRVRVSVCIYQPLRTSNIRHEIKFLAKSEFKPFFFFLFD